MCIMEVRAGQRSSTIAQACAHNTSTIERDVDMFRHLLVARGESDRVEALDRAQATLKVAYDGLIELFDGFVADEVHQHGHDIADPDHNSVERTFNEQAQHDAHLAKRYETRK